MDIPVIILKSNDVFLKLSPTSHNWCQVSLGASGQEYHLGADEAKLILKRLFNALSQENNSPIGEIGGVKVSWVLSLSEGHSTIYISEVGTTRCLYFEDIDGRLIATLTLLLPDVEAWLAHLKCYETDTCI